MNLNGALSMQSRLCNWLKSVMCASEDSEREVMDASAAGSWCSSSGDGRIAGAEPRRFDNDCDEGPAVES